MQAGDPMAIFDRRLARRRRDRAVATRDGHDSLIAEVGGQLVDRLQDVRRSFRRVLILGCHRGEIASALAQVSHPTNADGLEICVQSDLSPRMAARAAKGTSGRALAVAADEEALPFANGAFDLVLSAMSLHLVNDLPGALIQIRRALRPDGLFLAAFPGGDSLAELRAAWIEAELAVKGGASPRVAPFADMRDAAHLLQRAGFALPVADSDRLTVTYPSALALIVELRAMGASNALMARSRTPVTRGLLTAAADAYTRRHAGADGRIPARFEIVTLTGWAPAPSQPRALMPGSASTQIADALEVRPKRRVPSVSEKRTAKLLNLWRDFSSRWRTSVGRIAPLGTWERPAGAATAPGPQP